MRATFLFLFFSLLVTPSFSLAQFELPGNTATIEISPAFPKPEDIVAINLNAFAFDTTGATIRWAVDGQTEPSLENKRSFTLRAGKIGETTNVTGIITLRDGRNIPATKSFSVSDIDLIVDADTLVPSFYEGRQLPSIGSRVQVTAIPNTSAGLAPSAYSYSWRLNDKVIDGGSVFGGYVANFNMPTGKSANLRLDVSDDTGVVVAQKNISIPSHEPELLFYLDNPLRGLSRIAIPKNFVLQGGEASFRAEPFFMDSNILNQNTLLEWKINGRTLENPADDKQSIILKNAGGSGTFNVEFHLRNLSQLLQGVRDSFNLRF